MGYIGIRSPYTPYSIYLRGIVGFWVKGFIGVWALGLESEREGTASCKVVCRNGVLGFPMRRVPELRVKRDPGSAALSNLFDLHSRGPVTLRGWSTSIVFVLTLTLVGSVFGDVSDSCPSRMDGKAFQSSCCIVLQQVKQEKKEEEKARVH